MPPARLAVALAALLVACGDEGGLSESRPSFRLVGPGAYDFGQVYLGVERSAAVVVRDEGVAPMELCAALSPAGPGFSGDLGCRRVPAGAEVEIRVRFLPRQIGRATATLVLTHDAREPSAAIPLAGEGLAIPPCDDDNPCTLDTFDPVAGRCTHPALPEGSACDDGKVCTVGDVCVRARCVGSARECSDGNACTRDACEEPRGCVHFDTLPRCDDHNPCTADDCDPEDGCVHQELPDGFPCEDGVSCTYGEVCIAGACTGLNVPDGTPCSDGDPCTSDDACQSGRCVSAERARLVPGDVRWTFDTQAATDAPAPRGLRSPGTLDAAGNLYLDDDPGTLVSLDACGRERWRQAVASRNLHLNYRRMAQSQLLISIESESTDRPGIDVVRARLLETGAPLWTASLEAPRCVPLGADLPACVHTPPLAVRINDAALTPWGAVVLAGHQEFASEHTDRLYELEHFIASVDAGGRLRWRTLADAPQDEWMFGYPLLVASDGRAFAGTWAGYAPGHPSRVYTFGPDGAPAGWWDWPELNDYLTGAPGVLFEASRVRARDFSGRLLWERSDLASPRSRLNYGAVVRPDGSYVFLRTDWEGTDPSSELVAVDPAGALLWRHRLPGQPTASIAATEDGTIYTAVDWTVIAIGPDGERRFAADLPTGGQKLRNILTVGAPGHLYTATPSRLYAVWIGPARLSPSWSRFRGGNANGCTIPGKSGL